MTNNRYLTTGYGRRDYRWARLKLVEILKECCTFDKKEVTEVEVEEPVMQEVEKDGQKVMEPVLDRKGQPKTKKVKKKDVKITQECLLTDEQAEFVGKMAEEFQKKAIERSKVFLANAVKNTGAQLIQFQGEEGYLVEGSIRKYVVNKRTNMVYNYETKGYICIVEPGHIVSVGFDALAARLYALKNDSVMVTKISTLRHG